ncbi:hypothetical protein F4801DRAFT_552681 [Xylaria longipes]|nr:hypothetical protein F4801DRAFT_552681 [Xylaria longipes]RYC62651.1 hypothetical protein CHU98_g3568 [Xylaria longipes]
MAFGVFDSADQTATFFLCIFTTPICVLLTVLRFSTTQRRSRKIGLEDWLALAALIFYLVWVAYALAAVIIQNGRNVLELGALPKKVAVQIIQAGYVVDALYVVNQACAKFSILALYYRIFSVNRTFVRWTYGVAIVTTLWFISMFIERLLVCNPPAKLWDPSIPGFCVNSQIVIAAGESINSLLDFIMIGMALYVVNKLKISPSQRFQLSLIFAIGGLAGVIGPIKIAFAYGKVDKDGTDLPLLIAQMAASCICCCVPLHRSFIPEMHIFKSLRSTLFSSRSKQTQGESSSGGLGPSIVTIGQRSTGKRGWSEEDWLPLHENTNSRDVTSHAWADTESQRSGREGGPTQTVEFHQVVEHRP